MIPAGWDILTGDRDRDRRNVSILMESVAELYGPRPMDDLLRHAVDRALQVTGAQRGILLFEGADGHLAPRVVRGPVGRDQPTAVRYSRTIVETVRASGKPHITIDAEDPRVADLGQSVLDLKLLSIMATPLQAKGRALGVLYVDSTVHAKEFVPADLVVFQALGGLIALAVENGRLLEERVVKERMSRDLAMARQIQMGLFPKELPTLPGYDIAGECRSYEETSGDYWDVLHLPAGRVALVIGDVSGHGLGPAMIMASTRANLHALLWSDADPVRVSAALNDFLRRDIPPGSYVSLFLGVLDPARGSLVYVNAGHPPALIGRRDGSLLELKRTGRPIGLFPDGGYRLGGPESVGPGDVLLLYTDGVTEAADPSGERYEEERLRASLGGWVARAHSARGVLDGLLADLARFTGGRAAQDDVTALVLRAG